MTELQARIQEAAAYLKEKLGPTIPSTMVVLGSGFKSFADEIKTTKSIPINSVPHAPAPTVAGHGGQLIVGTCQDRPILVQTGRSHLYEGHSAHDVVFLIRSFAALGVRNLLVTNAAGGLHTGLAPGDIVSIEDQINLTGANCLIGAADLGTQFVDMCACYDPDWRSAAQGIAGVKSGVYLGVTGPTYETPAETRAFRSLGADMAGMSTVQETIAARQLGLRVGGLSFVTNLTGGLAQNISHEEVLEISQEKSSLLRDVLARIVLAAPQP